MNNIPFDLTLDKATERELVYDIVERLSLGKDLTEGTTLYFKAKTKLVDIFKRLILNLPPSLVLHFADIKIGIISISAGQKSGTCRLSGLKEGEIVLAYSEQTQMDIKELIVLFVLIQPKFHLLEMNTLKYIVFKNNISSREQSLEDIFLLSV